MNQHSHPIREITATTTIFQIWTLRPSEAKPLAQCTTAIMLQRRDVNPQWSALLSVGEALHLPACSSPTGQTEKVICESPGGRWTQQSFIPPSRHISFDLSLQLPTHSQDGVECIFLPLNLGWPSDFWGSREDSGDKDGPDLSQGLKRPWAPLFSLRAQPSLYSK